MMKAVSTKSTANAFFGFTGKTSENKTASKKPDETVKPEDVN